MKFNIRINKCIIIVALLFTVFSFSCEKSVDLNNPFDPDVILSSPKLWVASVNDTSVTLSWKSDIVIANENAAKNIWIIIEQEIYYNDQFLPIDTIKEFTNTATIKEVIIPSVGYNDVPYTFRICLKVGSKSVYSNLAGMFYWK
jgi:hypothetical protein